MCVQSNINTARRVRIMILAHLHLGVDHACVLTLPVDVVHLGEVILLPQQRVQDVVLHRRRWKRRLNEGSRRFHNHGEGPY